MARRSLWNVEGCRACPRIRKKIQRDRLLVFSVLPPAMTRRSPSCLCPCPRAHKPCCPTSCKAIIDCRAPRCKVLTGASSSGSISDLSRQRHCTDHVKKRTRDLHANMHTHTCTEIQHGFEELLLVGSAHSGASLSHKRISCRWRLGKELQQTVSILSKP